MGTAYVGAQVGEHAAVVALHAYAPQRHYVGMPQRPQQRHLDPELFVALHPQSVQPLHCHLASVRQQTLVHLRAREDPNRVNTKEAPGCDTWRFFYARRLFYIPGWREATRKIPL